MLPGTSYFVFSNNCFLFRYKWPSKENKQVVSAKEILLKVETKPFIPAGCSSRVFFYLDKEEFDLINKKYFDAYE